MTKFFLSISPKTKLVVLVIGFIFFAGIYALNMVTVSALKDGKLEDKDKERGYVQVCGKGKNAVPVKFKFGCVGDKGPDGLSPIHDLAYSLIRFLSVGAGIAVTISIIVAGIQYSASEGNAEVTMAAKKRIQNAMIGLLVYIFTFSILQYLIPGGIFNPGFWLFEPNFIFKISWGL